MFSIPDANSGSWQELIPKKKSDETQLDKSSSCQEAITQKSIVWKTCGRQTAERQMREAVKLTGITVGKPVLTARHGICDVRRRYES